MAGEAIGMAEQPRERTPARGMLRRALAMEFYQRVRRSTAVGSLGALIMAAVEVGHASVPTIILWTLAFMLVMLLRVSRCHRAIRALDAGERVDPLPDALLPMATAALWGSSVFFFDSGMVDPLFFARLIILFTGTSFVLASLSVYPRSYVGFVSVLWAALLLLCTQGYVAPVRSMLLVGLPVYFVMLVANSYHLGRLARASVIDHQRARVLSARLSRLLAAERQLLMREREAADALARANRELDRIARHDGLTGLMNRNTLFAILELELERARRGTPLCMALIDVDHFKAVNDGFGHLVGDVVLRGVADRLASRLRGGDALGRYGGEEFVVAMPGASIEAGLRLAERLRGQIGAQAIETDQGPLAVTISVGLAQFQGEQTVEQLLHRADQALYQAKAQGRNRCCVAP